MSIFAALQIHVQRENNEFDRDCNRILIRNEMSAVQTAVAIDEHAVEMDVHFPVLPFADESASRKQFHCRIRLTLLRVLDQSAFTGALNLQITRILQRPEALEMSRLHTKMTAYFLDSCKKIRIFL